ncbi:unnamed protein product [Coregonus sp. 'balchen']|nr:unnamed protein product [Coregonus sp. 'balchen']
MDGEEEEARTAGLREEEEARIAGLREEEEARTAGLREEQMKEKIEEMSRVMSSLPDTIRAISPVNTAGSTAGLRSADRRDQTPGQPEVQSLGEDLEDCEIHSCGSGPRHYFTHVIPCLTSDQREKQLPDNQERFDYNRLRGAFNSGTQLGC